MIPLAWPLPEDGSEPEYYPPPSEGAAKIWPTKEEQQRPCHKCGQLPIISITDDGRFIAILHCFCPTLYQPKAKGLK